MWVVNGPSNFAGAPGIGATTLNDPALLGKKVRVSRGGSWQMGLNPLTGNTFYTKVLGNTFLTFSSPLVDQEEIIVESFS